MKKRLVLLLFLTVLIAGMLILATGIIAQDDESNVPEEKPTLVPASELIPLEPPEEDFKEVVILNLLIEANSLRDIRSIELENARIVRSYAPNLFNLQGGPWEVVLTPADGEHIQFSVVSPIAVEAETEGTDERGEVSEESPYTYVVEPGTDSGAFEWDLALPLYRDENALDVQEITILLNGEEVFSTEVNKDEWRRQTEEEPNTDESQ